MKQEKEDEVTLNLNY